MEIILGEEILAVAPGLRVIVVEADVENPPTGDELWSLIEAEGERLRRELQIPDIARRPAIAATRAAYKACGKEPNRYRPSAEALCRRVLQGKGLYRISTLVDVINLLSMRSGYSIGGFDADKIEGDTLRLGVGRHEEPFEAIGRGMLNIESLPVYRDAVSGIGTPTSDIERTKITDGTKRLLMTVNIYGEGMPDEEFERLTEDVLTRFASARNIRFRTVRGQQNA